MGRQGSSNNINLCLIVLEAGSPTSVASRIGFYWSHLLTCIWRSFCCVLIGLFFSMWVWTEWEQALWWAWPSWTHLILSTSQRPSFQTPSHWKLWLQHMNLDRLLCWSQPINSDALGLVLLEHSPRPGLLLATPHRHFPNQSQCCARLALCLLLWRGDTLQQKPSGNFEEQDLWLTGPGGYMAYLRPHSKVEGRERKTEREGGEGKGGRRGGREGKKEREAGVGVGGGEK